MPLVMVPVEEIGRAWPVAAPLLEKAISYSNGATSLEAEFQAISAKQKQLWFVCVDGDDGKPVVKAAGVTSIQKNEEGPPTANIEFLSGENMKQWFGFKADLEQWARDEGCGDLRLWARKGWAKYLPDFTITHYIMKKVIA